MPWRKNAPRGAERKLGSITGVFSHKIEVITRRRLFSWKALFLFVFIIGFCAALIVAWKKGYFDRIFGHYYKYVEVTPGPSCTLYGVNDDGGSDSQFFKLNTGTKIASKIGPEYADYDIEGIDISPLTGEMYAIAAGGGNKDGNLYKVNKTTGALTLIGNTGTGGSDEIVSASFHPDGTLWAFQEDVGLVTIDLDTAKATLQWKVSGSGIDDNWEGLAWDLAGTKLYGTDSSDLFEWDPVTKKATKLCGNMPGPIEALEMRPDGVLVGSRHGGSEGDSEDGKQDDDDDDRDEDGDQDDDDDDDDRERYSLQSSGGVVLGESDEYRDDDDEDEREGDEWERDDDERESDNDDDESDDDGDKDDDNNDESDDDKDDDDDHDGDDDENQDNDSDDDDDRSSGYCKDGGTFVLFEINTNQCTAKKIEYTVPYCDVESLAFESCEAPPPDTTTLSVTKTVTDTDEDKVEENTADKGEAITYTLTVQNTGSVKATGVMVTDDYDEHNLAITNNGGGSDSGNTITWNIGDLAAGASQTKTITATLNETVVQGSSFVNTLTVTAGNAATVTDQTTTHVPEGPPPSGCNITVTKEDSPDPVRPDGTLTYTMHIINEGTEDCTEVAVQEVYDNMTEYVSAVPSPATGNNKWSLGTIAPGSQQTITITMTMGNAVQDGYVAHNRVCVWAAENGSAELPEHWVCDDEGTTVEKLPPSTAVLSITKRVSDDNEDKVAKNTTTPDTEIVYTITVGNTGNASAFDVMVEDDYQENAVTVVDAGGGVNTNGAVTWDIGVINPGQTVTKEMTALVPGSAPDGAVIPNSAEARASNADTVTAHAETEVNVVPLVPVLQVTKVVSDEDEERVKANKARPQDVMTYEIKVKNTGNATAGNVTFSDDYDEGRFTVTNPGGGTDDGSAVAVVIGDLAPGQERTILLAGTLKSDIADGVVFINTAEARADNAVPASDWVQTTAEVPPPADTALSIEKLVSDDDEQQKKENTAQPGNQVTYTMKVTNTGAATALTVVLTDDYDQGSLAILTTDGGTNNGDSITWSIGDLPTGVSVEKTITAALNNTLIEGDVVTNTSSAHAQNASRVDESVTTRVTTPLIPAYLAIEKTVSDSDEQGVGENTAESGAAISYQLQITNTGTSTALQVQVVDDYPEAKISITNAAGGTDNGSNIQWGLGDMAPGAVVNKTITALISQQALPGEHIENKATARAGNASTVEGSATTIIETPPQALLAVVKRVSDTNETLVSTNTAAPGELMTYTITVTNTSTTTAKNVSMSDDYDEVAVTLTGAGGGTENAGTLVWGIGDLAPAASTTKVFMVSVKASVADGVQVDNVVTVTATNANQDSASTLTEVVVPVPPDPARLQVVKTVTDRDETSVEENTAVPGEEMTYTVTVVNTGATTSTNTMLTDDYDEAWFTVSDAGTGFVDNGIITFSLGLIGPGKSVKRAVIGRVASSTPDSTAMINAVTADADNTDPATDDLVTHVAAPQPEEIDVELDKLVNKQAGVTNDTFVFTLTATNQGPGVATGVQVRDTLPSGIAYVSHDGAGTYTASSGLWDVGELPAGTTKSIQITVRAVATGVQVNIAEVTATNEHDVDSTPNNHIATEDDQDQVILEIDAPPPPPPPPPGGCSTNCGPTGSPRIVIDKSVNVAFANPGQRVQYTMVIKNTGNAVAYNAYIDDTLPAGMHFADGSGVHKLWSIGNMQAGAESTVQYEAVVDDTARAGNYENVAVATIANGSVPDNKSEDRASIEVRIPIVAGDARLDIGKIASVTIAGPNQQFTYTVTIQNIGSAVASNVTVRDVLPSGFEFVDGGGREKDFQVGDLSGGEMVSVTYPVRIAATAGEGVYTNNATASAINATPVSAHADVRVFVELPETGIADTQTGGAFAGGLMTFMTGAWMVIYATKRRVRPGIVSVDMSRPEGL